MTWQLEKRKGERRKLRKKKKKRWGKMGNGNMNTEDISEVEQSIYPQTF